MLSVIIWAIIVGAIVGVLGRLVVPGRQNLSIWLTIGIGIVAALVGGLIANALGVGNTGHRLDRADHPGRPGRGRRRPRRRRRPLAQRCADAEPPYSAPRAVTAGNDSAPSRTADGAVGTTGSHRPVGVRAGCLALLPASSIIGVTGG